MTNDSRKRLIKKGKKPKNKRKREPSNSTMKPFKATRGKNNERKKIKKIFQNKQKIYSNINLNEMEKHTTTTTSRNKTYFQKKN